MTGISRELDSARSLSRAIPIPDE